MKENLTCHINTSHVMKQFSRRKNLLEAQFLYKEIALRMINNLKFIKIEPNKVLDVGCGSGENINLLKSLYKKSCYVGLDNCETLIKESAKKFNNIGHIIKKLIKNDTLPHFIQSDMALTPLKSELFDLIWSNLALHWHPQPVKVLKEWNRLLNTNGLVMFSCFGPSSIIEIKRALNDEKLYTKTMNFMDMHDFGDILLKNGFEHPVVSQEIITLKYLTPEKLIRDVYAIGGNPSIGRKNNMTSKKWLSSLYKGLEKQRDKLDNINLTIEIIYGQAWKKTNYKDKFIKIKPIKK